MKMNIELLKAVLGFQCESYDKEAQDTLASFAVKAMGKVRVLKHASGWYVTKGAVATGAYFPCLVAHLDQVHSTYVKYKVHQHEDTLFAFNGKMQVGVGGDDKCGVYLAIAVANSLPACKVYFPYDEEVGCIGSNKCRKEFFDDVYFMIQGDRRHNTADFIVNTNGINVVTDAVKLLVKPIIKRHAYSFNEGTMTDIGTITEITGVCSTNLSAGYFDAHTKAETVSISKLQDCVNLSLDLFDALKGQRHLITKDEMNKWGNYGTYSGGKYYSGGTGSGGWKSALPAGKGHSAACVNPKCKSTDIEQWGEYFRCYTCDEGWWESASPTSPPPIDGYGMDEGDYDDMGFSKDYIENKAWK